MTKRNHVVNRWVAVASCCAALPMLANAADIRVSAQQIERAGITTQAVGEMVLPGGLQLPAQVVIPPSGIEIISAPLPAMANHVRVAYGSSVRRGDVLARLTGPALLEARREFFQAEAQASLASENRKRDEALFAEGLIAQSRLSASAAAEKTATAALSEKRQSLQLAGLTPVNAGSAQPVMSLRAPFDGVVLESMVQPGQRVDLQTPLFKLARLSTLWLEIQVSALQAANLAPGDLVAVPGCPNPAKVTVLAPQLQAASQSMLARAELMNPNGCVKPFQFVQVQVKPKAGSKGGDLRLPPSALVRHQSQTWVFVATELGFQPIPAQVIEESAEAVLVAAALTKDARVAVKGIAAIKAAWLGLGSGED